MEDEFNAKAQGQSGQQAHAHGAHRQRDMPTAEAMLDAGITTRETLEFLRQRKPPVPHPEPSPEDPAGWRTAIASADAQHDKWVGELKARFEQRGEKLHKDHNTAQQQSRHERGQGVERDQGHESQPDITDC